ncbi:hypothetical protein [Clostridium brassicae]|uniref:Uncharacterized protein n=1 Tax=Clostridium brassicae TaxID=2999072 RepID=A0ABT4D9C1_9CLOT|nr:hypothetical protein [Clostridium brassicae]MCY6958912.1 hypothetical protein [Clostridium brassicae]
MKKNKQRNSNELNQNSSLYGPNERGYLEEKPKIIKAHSQVDYTELPDPVRDPIVSNDISNAEFDYTYNGGDDILG